MGSIHRPDTEDGARLSEVAARFGGLVQGKPTEDVAEGRTSEGNKRPLNIRLLDKRALASQPLTPRGYQQRLYLKTLDENVIIYLGTGLGKTFITVLYLNSAQVDAQIQSGRRVAFLAPTQDLIRQQAEYIFGQVPYTARVYCGATFNSGIHVDKWKGEVWRAELSKVEVMFMTPQIFASAIATNLLDWRDFSTVIFDEAHHACKSKKSSSGHPYYQILKNYGISGVSPKPRLIGLTASLINKKPKNAQSIVEGVEKLEALFCARCVTDPDVIDTKPHLVIHSFNEPQISEANDEIYQLLIKYAEQISAKLEVKKAKRAEFYGAKASDEDKLALAFLNKLHLSSRGLSLKPSSFHQVLWQLATIRLDLGLWCLGNICYRLVVALEVHTRSTCISPAIMPLYSSFAAIVKTILLAIDDQICQSDTSRLQTYSQPMLMALLSILRNEYQSIKSSNKATFSCIVFVKSRVGVLTIFNWLREVAQCFPEYNFIKAGYAVGLAATMTSKWACITKRKSIEQAQMLDRFRKGLLNVIVTTSVLEEGIDLPVCSTVIRFHPAPDFRAYVQSRGRARQLESSFIAMCSDSCEAKIELDLKKMNDLESRVRDLLKSGARPADESRTSVPNPERSLHQDDRYEDPSRNISIDSPTAAIILNMYCSFLTRKRPYTEGIQYERDQPRPHTHRTTLHLPPGCPIQGGVTGGEKNSIRLADSSAVVAAVRMLHECKELDENAVPRHSTVENVDKILAEHQLEPDMGPLEPELEGEVERIDEREVLKFKWSLFQLNERLSRNSAGRRYKLFRIRFEALPGNREDVRHLFEQPTLGLVVDSNDDLWPRHLFSHYGQFSVAYELLSDSLPIEDHHQHNNYLNYTHKLLSSLSLGPIRKDNFRAHCLFYLVPLDSQGSIDRIMLASSLDRRGGELEANDVVQLNSYYRPRGSAGQMFLVRRVRRDLSVHSNIPGMKMSFLDNMINNYGPVVRNFSQPILELMPIAKQVARTSVGKKVRSEHTTRCVFYPEQCLDLFDRNPAAVMQAYNLPEVIYKIYLQASLAQFLQIYLKGTSERRHQKPIKPPQVAQDLSRSQSPDGDDADKEEPIYLPDDHTADEEGHCSEDEADCFEEESDTCEDSTEDELDLWDDDSDQDDLLPKSKILSKREFNLRALNQENGIRAWDLDEYKVDELKPTSISRRNSYHREALLANPMGLWVATASHQQNILARLTGMKMDGFELDGDLSDEFELLRAGKSVDLNHHLELEFDRNMEPLKVGSLPVAFGEAFTHRRAGESLNLEALENVGDSFLKYIVSVVLFKTLDCAEGVLTSARSRLVCNEHFTHLAKRRSLGTFAVANRFEPEILLGVLQGSESCSNQLRPKDLADLFESIVGACLVYRGPHEAVLATEWLGLDIFRRDIFIEFHEQAVVFSRSPTALLAEDETCRSALVLNRKRLQRFQEVINYKFADASYLVQAFSHSSVPAQKKCTESYERLEFLGDSILDLLVTLTLYKAGFRDPGQITTSRSQLVNNMTFAGLALEYRFDIFIQHANQEMFTELNNVNANFKSEPSLNFIDSPKYDKVCKLLGDIFESVAGAIYLDSGCSLDAVWRVYYPIMRSIIEREIANPTKNYISQLFEQFPGRNRVLFEYFEALNADGEQEKAARCTIHELGEFFGTGSTKHQAKVRAAKEALANLPSAEVKAELDRKFRETSETARGRPAGRRGRRGGSHRGRGARSHRGRKGEPATRPLS